MAFPASLLQRVLKLGHDLVLVFDQTFGDGEAQVLNPVVGQEAADQRQAPQLLHLRAEPEVDQLQVSSPTLSRLGRMLVLQWAAVHRCDIECGDVKGAFLQGDGDEMEHHEPIYAKALDEVAIALGIPLNSAVQVVKAVYGLGQAPRSWWLSVDRFMTTNGAKRRRADPTIWILDAPFSKA